MRDGSGLGTFPTIEPLELEAMERECCVDDIDVVEANATVVHKSMMKMMM